MLIQICKLIYLQHLKAVKVWQQWLLDLYNNNTTSLYFPVSSWVIIRKILNEEVQHSKTEPSRPSPWKHFNLSYPGLLIAPCIWDVLSSPLLKLQDNTLTRQNNPSNYLVVCWQDGLNWLAQSQQIPFRLMTANCDDKLRGKPTIGQLSSLI